MKVDIPYSRIWGDIPPFRVIGSPNTHWPLEAYYIWLINNFELQYLLWLAALKKVSNLKGSFIAAFG